MTIRATYAAPTGLTAEIALYAGARRYTVALYLDDADGTPVRRPYRCGLTLREARKVARRYHRVLVERWGMELLWHSGTTTKHVA